MLRFRGLFPKWTGWCRRSVSRPSLLWQRTGRVHSRDGVLNKPRKLTGQTKKEARPSILDLSWETMHRHSATLVFLFGGGGHATRGFVVIVWPTRKPDEDCTAARGSAAALEPRPRISGCVPRLEGADRVEQGPETLVHPYDDPLTCGRAGTVGTRAARGCARRGTSSSSRVGGGEAAFVFGDRPRRQGFSRSEKEGRA